MSAWPDVPPLSPAVTVATLFAPLSSRAVGDRASVRVGVASSSAMVSAVPVTSTAPRALLPTPVRVTVPSGASQVLATASTVTVPVLASCPAAMVRVFALDSVNAPGSVWVPAAAATVTVTAVLDLPFSRAVTVAMPPASAIELRDSISAACGRSSSRMVSVAARGFATPLPPAAVAATATAASAASWLLS